jgi:hypothetical protein
MRSGLGSTLLFAGFFTSPLAAFGPPLDYSETISGDLPSQPSTAFAFDFGANTVSGTTHLAVVVGDVHFDVDFDSFAFTLPAGSSLAAMSLAFATTSSNASKADAELALCFDIGGCGAGAIGFQTVDFLATSPVSVDFGGALPLGSGIYTLDTHGLGIAPISTSLPESWSTDYVWTFNVIPEPGSIALAGLGLVLLGVARRRSR